MKQAHEANAFSLFYVWKITLFRFSCDKKSIECLDYKLWWCEQHKSRKKNECEINARIHHLRGFIWIMDNKKVVCLHWLKAARLFPPRFWSGWWRSLPRTNRFSEKILLNFQQVISQYVIFHNHLARYVLKSAFQRSSNFQRMENRFEALPHWLSRMPWWIRNVLNCLIIKTA